MIGNEANRNVISKYFLGGDYDYLLMMDTDNPPKGNPLDYIQYDKDVITFPTPISLPKCGLNNICWNVFNAGDKDYAIEARVKRGEGLEEVYAIGTGCTLIARRVLEALPNPFNPKRADDDHREITQDVVFSIRCQAEGFKLWAAWDMACSHYKELDLLTLSQ